MVCFPLPAECFVARASGFFQQRDPFLVQLIFFQQF